jgi:hypothetical protein
VQPILIRAPIYKKESDNMVNKNLLSFLLVGAVASIASAGTINVSGIGGGISLQSGPVGLGTFGNSQTNWTSASLAAAHVTLIAAGLITNNKITILAADTDDGLSLMVLIDQSLTPGAMSPGTVRMDSVANGFNTAFLNAGGGSVVVTPNSVSSRSASGDFNWNSNGGGNGFAWANQIAGNTTTFRFNSVDGSPLGLSNPATFQFATYNGSTWTIIPLADNLTSFSATDGYGFAAVTIPTPSAVAIAAGPLGLMMVRRRRGN